MKIEDIAYVMAEAVREAPFIMDEMIASRMISAFQEVGAITERQADKLVERIEEDDVEEVMVELLSNPDEFFDN